MSSDQVRQFTVDAEDDGIRLDRWFKRHLPEAGFGEVSRWARTGQLRIDGKRATPGDRIEAGQVERRVVDGEALLCVRVGKQVRAGERVLAFDELTGDQLFVDRVSYHFIRPHVGSGFVFRTGHIPDIAQVAGDQYYIKRLVGTPGDTIEIRGTALYRNDAPITGSTAFDSNAKRLGNYAGYVPLGLLATGEKVTVPAERYFALGDNSGNSQDGRYWGFVPAQDVVGRPLFVYFPFTRHWGPAR